MNKTKKRAAKRSFKRELCAQGYDPHYFDFMALSVKPLKFEWQLPLTLEYRIQNMKKYRDFHKCSLTEARDAVKAAMDRATARGSGSIPF